MKKILLAFMATMLFYGAYAQGEYEMKVSVEIWDGLDNNSSKCDNYYALKLAFEGEFQEWFYNNNVPVIPIFWNTYTPIGWNNLNPIGFGHKFYEHTLSFANNKVPKTIFTYGKREWKNWIDCDGYAGYNSFDLLGFNKNCYHGVFQKKIKYWDNFIDVQIYPKKIALVSNTNIIPVDDKIKIEATKGFVSTIYKWQYKLGLNGPWTDFPPALQTGETVDISAKDLLGVDAENNIAQNLYVRVSYGCFGQDKFSNALVFNTLLSSPHILSATPVPNTCFDEANGYMKIKFDRALKPNELLNIFIQDINDPNNKEQIFNLENLPPNNTIISSPILKPGQFKITLLGKYNGFSTYTDGINHSANADFVSPLPVSFAANKTNDVYCFAGTDGTITIDAAGGTLNYMLGYKKQWQADYSWVNFNQPNKHILNSLDTGTYQLRVKDANGCVELNQGNEVVRTVIITQPETPLQKELAQITNPLQFGSTDGSVKVILKGGTPKGDQTYNLNWTDINNNILNNYNNNVVQAGYETFLHDIGDGKYVLTATDDNYAKAANNSKQGCLLKDTFHVVEPQPITVNIEETHFISCKDLTDGQLVAHAGGGIKFPIDLPYHYEWFKMVNNIKVAINQSDSIATELSVGQYLVKITDFNNITKESGIYNLTEPDLLKVELFSTDVSCSGGNNGTAKAVVSGGTQPYQYEWTNTETTPQINNLTEGIYWAYIKDAHQCETQGQIAVVAPNPIKADSTVKHPACYQACDGSISLDVSGGTPPYTYQWSNGAITKDINNLCAGNYSVTITDAKNCNTAINFSLVEPLPITINLGQEKTLCIGQKYEADASISDPQAQYQWGSNTGFVANTAKVSLSDEGVYWVKATNSNNCVGYDTLTIHRKSVEIAAEFIATTQAFQGELVRFINLSLPSPDSISWLVPNDPNIQVISNTQNIAELKFADTGVYYISLKSYKSGCEKIFTKKVIVLEPQPFTDPGQVQEPFIKEFTIAPNPNNGQFIVKVTLTEQSKIRLRMYNILTNALVSDRQESGSSQYTLPYSLNVVSGTYFLLLETPKGNIMYKIIIN